MARGSMKLKQDKKENDIPCANEEQLAGIKTVV
jgi:hypothetical protein